MTGYPGFDSAAYPGDKELAWLKRNTNLCWCAYYLAPAPSHADTSWNGKRTFIAGTGFGIAPIYVGQQVTGPGSHKPSLAQGTQDGTDAAALTSAEGFSAGSFVYLDLENGPPLPDLLRDYVVGWCDAVVAAGFGSGIYCSHALAEQIHELRSAARIWAFKVTTTSAHPVPGTNFPTLDPAGCGYTGASVWQLGQECQLNLPGAPLNILTVDLDVSTSPDPGAPDIALPPLVAEG